ncbi:alpha-ribazole phosphatase family protein [Thiothrix nivea]|uniref:phosphoglycerate mutase (2,3-diphosphoglycerate-dependent) n=1 Tax=Thiothrix nivea (strain ATCC 35100 / DSM 5205 / JP2) TaxID=870187 RepID=A0A656HAC9_THINJ|nr:alpha-ribazole phosphatase family protein [Thiothrix nivea]EIJ33042.1 Phosphoglycerate mutase [Thiothrix nivea DSM 5205]
MPDNSITHIGLLQHGAVEAGDVFCGELETPLSKPGWKQLKQCIGRGKPDWDAIVTSPKMQCAAFAEWLAEKHDLPLVRDERLQEIHFGAWEGCSPQQVMETHPEQLAQWWANPAQVTPEGGESFGDFRARVLDAWAELPHAYRGERVLTVTHAGVIRVILAHVLLMPDERLLALNIEHGALTRLRVLRDRGGHWASLLSHGC